MNLLDELDGFDYESDGVRAGGKWHVSIAIMLCINHGRGTA
jgi:hypothetical protein